MSGEVPVRTEGRDHATQRAEGRVALVTGGSRGIGQAVVRALAAAGARVVIADVLDQEGQLLEKELGPQTRYRHLDVTSAEEWRAVAQDVEETFGPVSVLVNNAGVLDIAPIEEQSPGAFRRVLDVNLVGAWLGLHTLAPQLRRAGGGAVVNISSTAGLMGYANLGAYTASKWGLRGLTKVAALEFAVDHVRVCSVHPGPIATPMTAGMEERAMAGSQPIPRFGTPEEVAAMVLFLVTEATYSTGSEFVVDGGATTGSMLLAQ